MSRVVYGVGLVYREGDMEVVRIKAERTMTPLEARSLAMSLNAAADDADYAHRRYLRGSESDSKPVAGSVRERHLKLVPCPENASQTP